MRESARTFAEIVRLNRQRAQAARTGSAALAAAPAGAAEPFDYDEALRLLVARGVTEFHLREGSVPHASLELCGRTLREHLPSGRALTAVHVGNFVGVSLAFFTSALREKHEGSVVIGLDPNLPHRGIADPERHVLALLSHFGLAANSVVVPGFSLERNLGDDTASASVPACIEVLVSLAQVARPFDLAVIDGNHDPAYLARELTQLDAMLGPGAILILDDVNEEAHPGVVDLFARLVGEGAYDSLARDGRVAVLRRTTGTSESAASR
ncbi:MAG: class I SAM-dependent methyltransferase [Actinomycetota bacterium]|nr:class I SAM-dependent methyltransferase [Actinomycetota bacterium]